MKATNQNLPERNFPRWPERVAVILSLLALLAYFTQAWLMQKAMRVDQRAWISVPMPTVFPLNGTSIPIATQIIDGGKTPARNVEGNLVATVLNKGEDPSLGDFSVGHPHNHIFAGAAFPGTPIPVNISVLHYGSKTAETVIPDDLAARHRKR